MFTPFQLNEMVDLALKDNLPPLWIEGELLDVSERNGHVYFTLCDPQASVRGVMFASDVRRVRALFADGQQVRLKVVVGLFVPRGQFQIRALVALHAGAGDRAAEVARLKKKLSAEGLFDPARKRPLPAWPSVVGVVTSRGGAAVHDILEVARSRMPVRLVLAHATVQGPEAPRSIVEALVRIARVPGIDVIVLARGGGASDDLSAFDEEMVARAIATCPIPVVTGVGHETDVTLADLVADVRAATPSHATETTIPPRDAPIVALERAVARIERTTRQRVERLGQHAERSAARLVDPRHRIARLSAEVQRHLGALDRSIRQRLGAGERRLSALTKRIAENEPAAQVTRGRAQLERDQARVFRAMHERLRDGAALREALSMRIGAGSRASAGRSRAELAEVMARLHALSPMNVLGRGYAIALHVPTGRALLRASEAEVGDRLELRLAEGTLDATVTRRRDD